MVVGVLAVLGMVLGALALARSVSDHLVLKKAFARERARALELEKRLAYHSKIASEVAHELKNPITAVVCAADTLELLLDHQLEDTHRSTLRYIKEYGEYVLTVMGDFIDVSRGVIPDATSKSEVVAVTTIVQAVVGLLGPSAGSRGVSLTLVEGTRDLHVKVDPKHLKQILFNLVHNGVKFTPAGGEVVVGIDAFSDTDSVLISVTDTGLGIAGEAMEHIKSAKTPRQSAHSIGNEGHGIGLLLAQGLIAQSSGELHIESVPGGGTCMQILFPKAKPPVSVIQEQAEISPVNEERHPFRGQSVLLVDSDLGAREAVRTLIEALGGAVDGVSLATQAVEALKQKTYTAVVIDEDMLGDSNTLTQMLQGEPRNSGAKIILASTNGPEGDACAEAIADSVVQKPICKRSLLDSLLNSH